MESWRWIRTDASVVASAWLRVPTARVASIGRTRRNCRVRRVTPSEARASSRNARCAQSASMSGNLRFVCKRVSITVAAPYSSVISRTPTRRWPNCWQPGKYCAGNPSLGRNPTFTTSFEDLSMQRHPTHTTALGRGIVLCLLITLAVGLTTYGYQSYAGLGITGMSRDVAWGIYISQFTFLVGIAASSVLVVLPRYVHGESNFAPLVLIGETTSVSALIGALAFVFVDLGRPSRILGVILHAAPTSLMFWDMLTLSVYFLLCITILLASLTLPKRAHPGWLTPVVLVSVPFAFGIHIVTALLYAGLLRDLVG